jgi:hypothetical protein
LDADLVGLRRKEPERRLRLVAGAPDGIDVDLSLAKPPVDVLVFLAIGRDSTAIRCPGSVGTMFLNGAPPSAFYTWPCAAQSQPRNGAARSRRASASRREALRPRPGGVTARRTNKADASAAQAIAAMAGAL